MKFKVSKLTDVICEGCGGTTRLSHMNGYVYDTNDLTCNCPKEGELFGRADVAELTDKEADEEPKPNSNAKDAQAEARENPSQSKMFEEEPENVFEEETMNREDVTKYLKTLKWQELLNSAKNNGVAKQPKTKREQLEKDIIDAVFGDADEVVIGGDDG